MPLSALEVYSFRCFQHAAIQLSDKANFFTGLNGSGKTSTLEAVYLLAHGRSFRSNDRRKLCAHGSDSFAIRGSIATSSSSLEVRYGYDRGTSKLKIADAVSGGFAEVAAVLPVRIIDSYAHLLVEGPPVERRRFLDWGVFHVEHAFVRSWRLFQRLLRQRNAALKAQVSNDELEAWDAEFCHLAEKISEHRQAYLRDSLSFFLRAFSRLLPWELEIRFYPGWRGNSLTTALRADRSRDRIRQTTHSGPHRANIAFLIEGRPAAEALSRGQQKLLAAALILGQIHYAASINTATNVLLVDEPAAELDVDNFEKLAAFIAETPAQLLVTGTSLPAIYRESTSRAFHVEQGCISPVV